MHILRMCRTLAGLEPIGSGGGFADSFDQPATLGWRLKRADRQTSNNSGPGIDPQHPGHCRANAIGVAANIILPVRKAVVGFQFLHEFSNSYTVQG